MSIQQLSAAICEDNSEYLNQLKTKLLHILPVSVQQFPSCQSFLQVLQTGTCPFDLVFMDIELGEFSGIELAEKITVLNPCTQIIFISQYLNYVSPVYQVKHTFFIYKPELDTWLKPAVAQALKNISELSGQFLQISWNKKTISLFQQKILYMERTLRTTNIHMADQKIYYTSEKFSDLIRKLNSCFIQCHRSYIVNLNYVSAFNDLTLFLRQNEEIPVSRKQAENVKKCLACI